MFSEDDYKEAILSTHDLYFVFDGENKISHFLASDESLLYIPPNEFLGGGVG